MFTLLEQVGKEGALEGMGVNHCCSEMGIQRAQAKVMGKQVGSSSFSRLLGGSTAAFPFLCMSLQRIYVTATRAQVLHPLVCE